MTVSKKTQSVCVDSSRRVHDVGLKEFLIFLKSQAYQNNTQN